MLQVKKYQHFVVACLVTLFMFGSKSQLVVGDEGTDTDAVSVLVSEDSLVEPSYSVVLPEWKKKYQLVENTKVQAVFQDETTQLLTIGESKGYSKEVVMLKEGDSIEYKVSVPTTGLYQISMDYFSLATNVLNT